MKWLKRKIRSWLDDDEPIALRDHVVRVSNEPDTECIRFKVFRANGGMVVQTDRYDRKNDRQYDALHVIVDGQDIGTEIGKIITYESLKL